MATSNRSSNRGSGAFNNMKYEVANELGIPLNENTTEPDLQRCRPNRRAIVKVFADFNNHQQQ